MYKIYLLVLSSPLALAAPPQGFGDATEEEIAQIRAGTYQETINDNPAYSFNYKVADDTEQVYMSRDESRDGATVTGSYSYTDPLGSLITVTYTAGENGYSETRNVQENFIKIRPKKQKVVRPVEELRPVQVSIPVQRPALFSFPKPVEEIPLIPLSKPVEEPIPPKEASLSQSDLIAQVVSQIQPLLSQTISAAVSGGAPASAPLAKTAPAPVSRAALVVEAAPVPVAVSLPVARSSSLPVARSSSLPVARSSSLPVARSASLPIARSSSLVDLFGSGDIFNVRFNTPSFNVEY